jgi:hypothetical protein
LAEVQPVWDRHCVRCHDYGQPAGKSLNLAPDRDLVFNASYNELWRRKWIAAVGAGPAETLPAYAWGSHRSRLLEFLRPSHYEVRLSAEEFNRVVTWIDLNAPYYPSYASAYPVNAAGRSPLEDGELESLEKLTGVPLRGQLAHNANRGPQVSFDRPAASPCLESLRGRNAAAHAQALELIERGQRRLRERPEADAAGFVACAQDRWREERYLARRELEARNRAAIRDGRKVYERLTGGAP